MLEEIKARVAKYQQNAEMENSASKMKTASLMIRLFNDEAAMKEIARSTMLGIFALLDYDLKEARIAYDKLMEEINKTYKYVDISRLKK